jgi:hypothetical protein
MDRYAKELIALLKPSLGDAAGLMVLREMKEVDVRPPIGSLDATERESLANHILDNILSRTYSRQKLSFVRSKLFKILDISELSQNIRYHDPEGWT